LLALNGQLALACDWDVSSRKGPPKPTCRPLSIGAEGLRVEVGWLKVYRDVYYLNPMGGNVRWLDSRPLGQDEFFLLGDNSPVSTDSRHWPAGVSTKSLVGRVLTGPKKRGQ